MDRQLCQFCNKIVNHDEKHACFLRKNYDNVHKLRPQNELREKDVKSDEAKYGITAKSNDSTNYSIVQIDANISKKTEFLATKKNEQGSFRYNLERKRTFSSLSDETLFEVQHGNVHDILPLSSTLNIRPNEGDSTENTFLKSSSEDFEPDYKSVKGLSVDCKRRTNAPGDLYEENIFHPKPSTSNHVFSEEYQLPLKKRILKSFNENKKLLIKSSGFAQTAPTHFKNIPDISNVHFRPAFSSGNKETHNDSIEELRDLTDTSISPKVSSHMLGCREGMAVNMKQPLDSLKMLISPMAGPSGIRDDSVRNLKKFTCGICRKTFKRKCDFRNHYRTHTGEKPYVCDKCGEAFTLKHHLDNHDRTHTREKPYKCKECKKAFAQKGNLDTHYRTHTGEKPYVCEKCQKCFANGSNFKKHAKTHTRYES